MSAERRAAPVDAIPVDPIVYPESDGLPMAEHPLQELWIVRISTGIRYLLDDRADTVVAVDHFWYPIEGLNTLSIAPDVYVVFGRPKKILVGGRLQLRGCYKQWAEDGIAPQVVFEIRSPSNFEPELDKKLEFYDRYGAEEYYLIDPFRNEFRAWWRNGRHLERIDTSATVTSPRLGIHFVPDPDELRVLFPDGQPFRDPVEIQKSADESQKRADAERRRADAERRRADETSARVLALEERLRSLGLDP